MQETLSESPTTETETMILGVELHNKILLSLVLKRAGLDLLCMPHKPQEITAHGEH